MIDYCELFVIPHLHDEGTSVGRVRVEVDGRVVDVDVDIGGAISTSKWVAPFSSAGIAVDVGRDGVVDDGRRVLVGRDLATERR